MTTLSRHASYVHLIVASTIVVGLLGLTSCGGGLPPGGQEPGTFRLEGRVVDGEGDAVNGATIVLGGAAQAEAVADADGAFEFMTAVGDYGIDVVIAGVVVRQIDVVIDGSTNVDLGPLAVLVTARGHAVDSEGQGLAGVVVHIDGPIDRTLVSAEDGSFETQIAAGAHQLDVSWQGVEAASLSFSAELGSTSDLGDVFVLQKLHGRVLDGLLDPIENAKVVVESTPQVVMSTDADGAFATQLVTGTYRVRITNAGLALFDEIIDIDGATSSNLGDMQLMTRVEGRLVEEVDVPNSNPPLTVTVPVVGAEVSIDTSPIITTTSNSTGSFTVDVPLQIHQVCVLLDGIFVAHELVDASMPSATVLTLPDIVATPMPDVDGDTLGNSLETDGWMILVDEVGQGLPTLRHVTSSPFAVDTDDDTLTDVEEFGFRTDPARPDTDGDLLTDAVELRQYVSNPVLVDSDGDALPLKDGVPDSSATPSSLFFDGNEVMVLHTSPTLDDTDGDGFRDRTEVLEGGTNARVADLPKISIEVFGEPVVGFEGDVVLLEEQTQSSVANDTTSSRKTKEFNFKTEGSLDVEVKATAKAGFPGGFGGSVETTATLRAGLNTDYAYHTDSESAESMQNVVEATASQLTEFTAGKIEAAIVVQNESDLAVRYDNLHIIVFHIDPSLGSAGLKPLGELFEPDGTVGNESVLLGPQGTVTLLRENKELDLLRVRDYLANPTGLYFRIGDYSMFLVDEFGNTVVDYDVVAQHVVERTAQLSIDWGDGTSEEFLVATNVERNPDGTPAGLRMADALASIGYDFDTAPGTDPEGFEYGTFASREGKRLVTRIGSVANVQDQGPVLDEKCQPVLDENGDVVMEPIDSASRFWFVYGPGVTEPVFADPPSGSSLPPQLVGEDLIDFGEIRLMPGDAYLLQFQTDKDTDGLSQQQEAVYGTSDSFEDSDGDGLTDFEEVAIGWEVEFDLVGEACDLTDAHVDNLSYRVYPNPRFPDLDRDGKTDAEELCAEYASVTPPTDPCDEPEPLVCLRDATDPFQRDTDSDGILDADDPTNDACTAVGIDANDPQVLITFDRDDWDSGIASFADRSGFGNDLYLETIESIVDDLPSYDADGDGNKDGGAEWRGGVAGGADGSVLLLNERAEFLLSLPKIPLFFDDATDAAPALGPNFQIRRDKEANDAPYLSADAEHSGWSLAVWVSPAPGRRGTLAASPDLYRWELAYQDICNDVAAQADYFLLTIDGGVLEASFEHPENALVRDISQIPLAFTHVAITVEYVTFSGTTLLRLFRDGDLVASREVAGALSNPSAPGAPGGNVTIGSRAPYNPDALYGDADGKRNRFNGTLDELRIYDRPLSPEEVAILAIGKP